jgi:hypothetical protein
MPNRKRKYPTKEKTTTPEGYKEYKRLQMRDWRKRKRELKKQLERDKLQMEQLRNIPDAFELIFGRRPQPKSTKHKK